MPAAMMYPAKPEDVDALSESERKERQSYISGAWKYYRGEHKKPLKVKANQPDDNIVINVSKILVDRGISMLFGRGVEFQIGERSEDAEPSLEEEYLNRVWNGGRREVNLKQLQLNDIALNGYVTGLPAIRIREPMEEGGLPRIINLDPAMLVPFWRPDDIEDVLWYSIYWSDSNRQDIVKQMDEMTSETVWLIRDLVAKETKSREETKWRVVNEAIWEWPWAPILTWKNLPNPNEFYAPSEIDHADLNDKINFIASNINRILQKHAHPRTIGMGFTLGEILRDEVGGLITINKKPGEAELFNLEMQSDLVSSMAYLELLRAMFFSLGASVDLTTIRDKIGQITNFGLRVLFKDALDRLIIKRALYGEALIEINRRILELGDFGDDLETKLHWPDPLPMNKIEEIEAVERKVALGILSKATAAKEVGEDFAAEEELIAEESAGADLGTLILQNTRFNRGQ